MMGLLRSLRSLVCLLALLVGTLTQTSVARTVDAVVTRVSDGDTVWLRTSERSRIKARLHGIDAPERCQAYGKESGEALKQMVLQRSVKLDIVGEDTYRRSLVRIELDGQDIGARMVREGHAWNYRWQGKASAYQQQEIEAKQAKRGLFADPKAMEPRVFRRKHGPCQ